MRLKVLMICLVMAGGALGCESAAGPETSTPDESSTPGPVAGGLTGDFGGERERDFAGSARPCDEMERIALDEVSSLGFSPQQILDTIAGEYEIPLTWFDRCDGDPLCGKSYGCEDAVDRPLFSIVGTTTVLNVSVHPTGESATAHVPGVDQEICATGMLIPVDVQLWSDDGAIDGDHEVQIGTVEGPLAAEVEIGSIEDIQATVHIFGPASILGGTVVDELPDGALTEFSLGTMPDERVWMDLFIIADNTGTMAPLLDETMISDTECPHDLPITELRQMP